ncbi:MAG: ATP-binding protein [Kofleriaceae bacterium]
MIELGLIDLRTEADVVRAHQTTRMIAGQLGFSTFEQTRIATAMSEIARNALTYASGGSVTLGLDDKQEAITIVVSDRGRGIPDLEAILRGEKRSTTGMGIGIPGSRRLVDALAIESSPSGTRVEMTKRIPKRGQRAQVSAMRTQLAGQLADDPTQEIRRLQRDVAERDQRISELSDEIYETNRGVMALHTELEDRAEYQREAVELRTRLLSEMGHELRTPLHSITAIAQFLIDRLDGELTVEQDRQVKIIHEVAESLTEYVNDLLDLARAEAGRATIHPKTISIVELGRVLKRILTPLVPNGVSLRFAIEPGMPPMITDEQKLSQILRNVIANALKFTTKGHVEVRATHAGDRIRFEVQDTGVGIAAEHHDLIFHEFAQVDGQTEPRMRGTGLGLPLSRRLATLLGGTLEIADSSPGVGSTFRLDLPREIELAPAAEAKPAEPAPREARPARGRPRILIIDDDTASRYVLGRWLDDRYEVLEAPSGTEGIQRARELPDAIFLDVVMSDLTGFEVLERLKADPVTAPIPVVVYSALVLGANDRDRLSAAVAILRKSTSSRVADRSAIEDALVKASVAIPVKHG